MHVTSTPVCLILLFQENIGLIKGGLGGQGEGLLKFQQRNVLDSTRCSCLQLVHAYINKKSLAFQSSEGFNLKLQLSFNISFAVPFHQFVEEQYLKI